jgi:hypothetical protein
LDNDNDNLKTYSNLGEELIHVTKITSPTIRAGAVTVNDIIVYFNATAQGRGGRKQPGSTS